MHRHVADFALSHLVAWLTAMDRLRHDSNYCLCHPVTYGYNHVDCHKFVTELYFKDNYCRFVFIKNGRSTLMQVIEPMF